MTNFTHIYQTHATAFDALGQLEGYENVELAADLLPLVATNLETRAWIAAAPFFARNANQQVDTSSQSNRTIYGMAIHIANNQNFPLDLNTRSSDFRDLYVEIRREVRFRNSEGPKVWNCLLGKFEAFAQVGDTVGQIGILAAAIKGISITGPVGITVAALSLAPMLTPYLEIPLEDVYLSEADALKVYEAEWTNPGILFSNPKRFRKILSHLSPEAQSSLGHEIAFYMNATQRDYFDGIDAKIDELSSLQIEVSQIHETLKDQSQQLQHLAKREELAQKFQSAKDVHDLAQAMIRAGTFILGIPSIGYSPEQRRRIESVCSNLATIIFSACTMNWKQVATTIIHSICNIGEVFAGGVPGAVEIGYLIRIHETVNHIAQDVGIVKSNTYQILDSLRYLTNRIQHEFAFVHQEISQMAAGIIGDAHYVERENRHEEFSQMIGTFEGYVSHGLHHGHDNFVPLLSYFHNYGTNTAFHPIFSGRQDGLNPIRLWDRLTQEPRIHLNFGLLHDMVWRINQYLNFLRGTSTSEIPENIDPTPFGTALPNPMEWTRAAMVFTGFREKIKDATNPIYATWMRELIDIGRRIDRAMEILRDVKTLRAGHHAYLNSVERLAEGLSQTENLWNAVQSELDRIILQDIADTAITSVADGFPQPAILHLGRFAYNPSPSRVYHHVRAAVNRAHIDPPPAAEKYYWIDKASKTSPNIDLFSTPKRTSPLKLAFKLGIIEASAFPCKQYYLPGADDHFHPHSRTLIFRKGYLTGLTIQNSYYYTQNGPNKKRVNMFCYYQGSNNTTWRDAVMQRSAELSLPPFINVGLGNYGNDFLANLSFMDFIYLYLNNYLEEKKASLVQEGTDVLNDSFENYVHAPLSTHPSNELEACLIVFSHFHKFGQSLSHLFDNPSLSSSTASQQWQEFKKNEIKAVIKLSMIPPQLIDYGHHVNPSGYFHLTPHRIPNQILADRIQPEIRGKLNTFFENSVNRYCAEIYLVEGTNTPGGNNLEAHQLPILPQPGSSTDPIPPMPSPPKPPSLIPLTDQEVEVWVRRLGNNYKNCRANQELKARLEITLKITPSNKNIISCLNYIKHGIPSKPSSSNPRRGFRRKC